MSSGALQALRHEGMEVWRHEALGSRYTRSEMEVLRYRGLQLWRRVAGVVIWKYGGMEL